MLQQVFIHAMPPPFSASSFSLIRAVNSRRSFNWYYTVCYMKNQYQFSGFSIFTKKAISWLRDIYEKAHKGKLVFFRTRLRTFVLLKALHEPVLGHDLLRRAWEKCAPGTFLTHLCKASQLRYGDAVSEILVCRAYAPEVYSPQKIKQSPQSHMDCGFAWSYWSESN